MGAPSGGPDCPVSLQSLPKSEPATLTVAPGATMPLVTVSRGPAHNRGQPHRRRGRTHDHDHTCQDPHHTASDVSRWHSVPGRANRPAHSTPLVRRSLVRRGRRPYLCNGRQVEPRKNPGTIDTHGILLATAMAHSVVAASLQRPSISTTWPSARWIPLRVGIASWIAAVVGPVR